MYDIIFPLSEVTDVWVFTGCSPSERVSSVPLMSGTHEGARRRTTPLNFNGKHNVGAKCHLDGFNFDPTPSCFQEAPQLATQEVPISRQMDSVDCLSCQFRVSGHVCRSGTCYLFLLFAGAFRRLRVCSDARAATASCFESEFLSLPKYR